MPDPLPEAPIRMIHHLARSGGTLLSRCLGCMKDVTLLSEIHPVGLALSRTNPRFKVFDPLVQASTWHFLLQADDLIRLQARGRPPTFDEAITLIRDKVRKKGKVLVVRDWTHLDYTGAPFVKDLSMRLVCADILRAKFPILQYCTVRHPIDQWLSLLNFGDMGKILDFGAFMHGYRAFAQECVTIGFLRYEDFVRDPSGQMRALCDKLSIPFDPDFATKWVNYRKVSGDPPSSRGRETPEIRPMPRRPLPEGLLDQFENNADYHAIRELLGYGHP